MEVAKAYFFASRQRSMCTLFSTVKLTTMPTRTLLQQQIDFFLLNYFKIHLHHDDISSERSLQLHVKDIPCSAVRTIWVNVGSLPFEKRCGKPRHRHKAFVCLLIGCLVSSIISPCHSLQRPRSCWHGLSSNTSLFQWKEAPPWRPPWCNRWQSQEDQETVRRYRTNPRS